MRLGWVYAACLLCGIGSLAGASAAEPCLGAKGNLSRERALFDGGATALAAGRSPEAAPEVAVARLYRIDLLPQDQVTFAAPPGRSTLSDGYAAVLAVTVRSAGAYRVSVDSPLWIDMAGAGTLAPVRDFQSLRGCSAPRKVVEFELRGATRFIVQLSSSGRPTVRLTLTHVP